MSENFAMVEWISFLSNSDLIPSDFFESTDEFGSASLGTSLKAAYGIGTGGIYNKRYGTEAVVNVIYSDEIMGLSPKRPYLKSGHPLLSAASATSGGGIALGGSVPAGDVRTYSQGSIAPKLHGKTVDINKSYKALEGKDDLISSDQLVRDTGSEWKDLIDRALVLYFDTASGNNIETVDRLTASSVEVTACGETAGDEDFMGIDKSANTWFNPYVSQAANVPRAYKLKLIVDALAAVEPYAKGPRGRFAYMLMTGYDTYWRTADQVGPSIWRQEQDVQMDINGISTDKGTPYSIRTPQIYKHPIFSVNHIKQSTISWMYGFNQDFMGTKILIPPGTVQTDNILITGVYADRYNYYMEADIYTDFSKVQFKIRDLL
jgi:hypothetical protein